jgi:DNA-binding CsgD family transcriptional regulator
MDKKVIFIHPSEIIAKGFYNILNLSFGMDLIYIPTIDMISNYTQIENSFILFIVDIRLKDKISYLDFLNSSNLTEFIWFTNCEFKDSESLYAYTPVKDVLKIVEVVLKNNNLLKEEIIPAIGLTDREIGVLKLVAHGMSNKDIGEKLFISIHTVISHRKNITEKLGIKSISGLTVYAILNKLVEPEKIT